MKLRIQPNHIVLRLSGEEIDLMENQTTLTDTLEFPELNKLSYSLTKAGQTTIQFDHNHIYINISKEEMQALIHSKTIGVERIMELKNGTSFHLTIERDLGRKSSGKSH